METLSYIGKLFYLVDPYETMYQKTEQVPDWIGQTAPLFYGLILLEHVLLYLQGKAGIFLSDGITSVSHGLLMAMIRLVVQGYLTSGLVYVHSHFRLCDLAWNHLSTWVIAAIAADLFYYWIHRACHEIGIFWAAHQVHHSSEDYNTTTALRQSVFQDMVSWLLYLPMALFIPPPHILAHVQFNLLFQFWIHTELVQSIGILENIINSPKHHKVHHASNLYALDKNYSAVLIVWDHLFGTFADEKPDEKLVFGLVFDQPQFLNPVKQQTFYLGKIWNKVKEMSTITDKIFAVIKGPGWMPGQPWQGDHSGNPKWPTRVKYRPNLPFLINAYSVVHFFVVLVVFQELSNRHLAMNQTTVLLVIAFLIWTLTSIGLIFDKSRFAWPNEFIRCLSVLILYNFHVHDIEANAVFSNYIRHVIFSIFGMSLVYVGYPSAIRLFRSLIHVFDLFRHPWNNKNCLQN